MATTSLSLVNQKLTQARLLLHMAGQADDAVEHRALLDGALELLACGYAHYLREIAESYRVQSLPSIRDEQSLLSALADSGKSPSEAQELAQLSSLKGSWVSDLHIARARHWSPPVPARDTKPGLINVVDLDAASSPPTLDTLNGWYRAFNDLILRQRETSAEY